MYTVIQNDLGVLTTCHTQYTWGGSICIFLFNWTTPHIYLTYLTGALYVHPLWFYKHQHENPVRSKLFVACQRFAVRRHLSKLRSKRWNVQVLHTAYHKRKLRISRYIGLTIYSYLKCIVYDKLLKPRQSFWITLYIKILRQEMTTIKLNFLNLLCTYYFDARGSNVNEMTHMNFHFPQL